MNNTTSEAYLLLSLQKQVAAGDRNAFRQLYHQLSKKMVGFAFLMVKQRDAAMEIVDSVFIKLWMNKKNADSIGNIQVYLFAAVKNASLNYLSKKVNEKQADPFELMSIQISDEGNPEQMLITSELYKKINAAINELPPRCKLIFKLVREDGLKYKEVAEILNISENTVDAQMVIAVQKISQAVKGQFDFFPHKPLKKK